MKPETYIREQIAAALKKAYDLETDVVVEKPRQGGFGDFATTVAMTSARALKTAPRGIAETIISNLADEEALFDKVTIAGPGFINIKLDDRYWQESLRSILSQNKEFGQHPQNDEGRVQIEFVSANPTGPLNVVSARAAVVGDVLVRVLKKAGYDAASEYYINDAGRQVRLLGESVAARYLSLFGDEQPVPEDGYHGEYIIDLAKDIKAENGDAFLKMDATDRSAKLGDLALQRMIASHQATMTDYRVEFDRWFRESELRDAGKHTEALEFLKKQGKTYEKDDAVWFKSTDYGDAKDRVLLTREGEPTYFLVDIAYHHDKFLRGFEQLYDLWGPDHHGYIDRVSAAMQALGYEKERFQVRIIQQVKMLRDGQMVKMSKRAGNIVRMTEILEEVGVDAARFFFVMRKLDSPLDFDIDLAKKQTDENPVLYVQYAHARLHSVLQHAMRHGLEIDEGVSLAGLKAEEELAVIRKLNEYPNIIQTAARLMEPHHITNYLTETAAAFHGFYHKHRVVTDDAELSQARLVLVRATQIVLANGLELLRIDAPERM